MASAESVIAKGTGLGLKAVATEAELLPMDYLATANPPKGRDSDQIFFEKSHNLRNMIELGSGLPGIGPEMVETCAHIAMRVHPNQFRDEPGSPHFSAHLIEVARGSLEVAKTLRTIFPELAGANGEKTPPEAVLICVSLLHRAQNDFAKNLWASGKEVNPEQAQASLREYIAAKLEPVAGPQTAKFVVDCLNALRNDNPEDFPDGKYIRKLVDMPFASCVKLAELSHDLDSVGLHNPEFQLVASPQVIRLAPAESPLREALFNKMLHCLQNFDPTRMELNNPGFDGRHFDRAVEALARADGSKGLDITKQYLTVMHIRLLELSLMERKLDDETLDLGLLKQKAVQLGAHFDWVSKSVIGSSPMNPFTLDDIEGRLIGPIAGFRAEITATPAQVREAMEGSQVGYTTSLAGYFHDEKGQSVFHLTRIPPSSGAKPEEAEALSRFADVVSKLVGNEPASGVEPTPSNPVLRAIFTLEDTRFEQCKEALLRSIESGETDFEQALNAARTTLGTTAFRTLAATSVTDLAELTEVLKSLDLVTQHNPDVLVNELELGYVQVKPVTTIAVSYRGSPRQLSFDEKPGLLVVGDLSHQFYEQLIRLADKYHLNGFALELPTFNVASTVEITSFSDEKRA